ncbi:MAG: hypothetical protein QM398_02275 [Thermoproteota archaeon]|nr:hypothetical protein [Thermoproteota archaeon]
MDKNKRNQLCFIVGGLFSLVLGLYLFTLHVERIIASLFTVSGIVFLISGIRYEERLKRRVFKGEERAAYARSTYFRISLIGAVILFTGMGGAVLTMYLNVPSADRIWILGVIALGGIILVVGRFFKKDTYET